MLYQYKDQCHEHSGGSLQMWVKKYGAPSLRKFAELSQQDKNHIGPVPFNGRFSQLNFQAYIDPENRFSVEDKLSQVNSLNHYIIK